MSSNAESAYNIWRLSFEEVGEDSFDPLLIFCRGGCMPTVETVELHISPSEATRLFKSPSTIPQQSKHFLYPAQTEYDLHS